jgi:hypothetical protein
VAVSEGCQKEAAKRFKKVWIQQLMKTAENYCKQISPERYISMAPDRKIGRTRRYLSEWFISNVDAWNPRHDPGLPQSAKSAALEDLGDTSRELGDFNWIWSEYEDFNWLVSEWPKWF